jgi:hypothetical protein
MSIFKIFWRDFLRFTVYSNIWVALCFCGLTADTYIQFDLPLDTDYLIFVFYSSVALYLLHRFKTVYQHSSELNSERLLWLKQHRLLGWVILIISLLMAAIFYFAYLSHQTQRLLVFFALFSLLYAFFYRKNNRWIGLRDVPYLKIFLLAGVIAGITFFIPVFRKVPNTTVWLNFLERIVFLIAVIIPFDVRDMDKDRKSIQTIPMLLGEKSAVCLATFMYLLDTVLLIYLRTDIRETIGLSLVNVISAIMAFYSLKNKRNDFYFSFYLELPMLLRGVGGLFLVGFLFTRN